MIIPFYLNSVQTITLQFDHVRLWLLIQQSSSSKLASLKRRVDE